MGSLEKALATCDADIAKMTPALASAWRNKGYLLFMLGRPDGAMKAYSMATTLNPGDAESWYGCGEIFSKRGQHAEALEMYDRAVRAKPDHALAWLSKGDAHCALSMGNDALDAYNRATELDPDNLKVNFKVWYNKGWILHRREEPEEALEALDEALKIKPNHVEALEKKGEVLSNLGRIEEAKEAFARAKQLRAEIIEK